MESGSAVPDSNWGSYQSQMQNEESEIVAQFLTPYPPYQNEQDNQDLGLSRPSSMFWSDQQTSSYYLNGSSNNLNIYGWSQGNSNNSSSSSNYLAPHPDNYENYYLNEPNVALEMNTISASVDINLVDEQNKIKSIHLVPNPNFGDQVMNEENCDENENLSPNESDSSVKRKSLGKCDGVKKKARSSTQVQKTENKSSSKKAKNNTKIGEEELENNNDAIINNKQSSSCNYNSDNDSNGSQGNNVSGITSKSSKGNSALNLNGKNRAGRGSATDPQSLYARKRRERINERLRILQNLVPNGTKVDISTMLEEAVQYVKFLQLQIKLLSSDEMWMYAPIAYNGMNLGIDLRISPPQ
ncbi:hypothetical protein LUZ60_010173 [Juncus effusus]|nr:hypothetical protein LUZ60_010173 [Juncus effusus]